MLGELDCDVIVLGGGPAGIGAALGAAYSGARVVLVERHPALGGMGTSALVSNFCPAHWDGRRLIIGGVFGRLRQKLIDTKMIYPVLPLDGSVMEAFNPEGYEAAAAELCRDALVHIRLKQNLSRISYPTPRRVTLSLSDASYLNAATIVDATGDAVLAPLSGVPFDFGRPGDHCVMPLTFCFEMGPVDLEALEAGLPGRTQIDPASGERFAVISSGEDGVIGEWFAAARQKGLFTIPRRGLPGIFSIPGRPSHMTVNIGRVFCADPTDPVQLLEAQEQGRRQAAEAVEFFRQFWPGMSQVKLVRMARQIGVRQTRQIQGLYTLTAEDIVACRQFEDVVCQCWYPIDLHDPSGEGTTMVWLKPGTHYDIPWRCLVPRAGPENLIFAGRSISATPEAMSSFRVAPSAMALGEAAGVTAALAALQRLAIAQVPPQQVQAQLRAQGGILE